MSGSIKSQSEERQRNNRGHRQRHQAFDCHHRLTIQSNSPASSTDRRSTQKDIPYLVGTCAAFSVITTETILLIISWFISITCWSQSSSLFSVKLTFWICFNRYQSSPTVDHNEGKKKFIDRSGSLTHPKKWEIGHKVSRKKILPSKAIILVI